MDGITTSINEILQNLVKNFNTLLDCPVRFSGEYNEQKVHNFIEYIEYYKKVKCITDEQALQELQYLLLDQAHDWWVRRKKNLNTWSEALTILENQFSKKRPANVIYTQLLKLHYEDYECKDDFIDDKIELLNELSQPELEESNKFEIIYALLPDNIQNKVKLVNNGSIQGLKEQLKFIKLDSFHSPSTNSDMTSDLKPTSEVKVDLTEDDNTHVSNNDSNCREENNITFVDISSEMENDANSERDPIIKVRRTEDLMPQDTSMKKGEASQMRQEEFSANGTELQATNNIFHTNHDNYQLDADRIKQINNITDKSEKNTSTINSNRQDITILSQPSKGIESLKLLRLETQPKMQPKKPHDHESYPTAEKKVRKRCPHCRSQYHTADVCNQKVKKMKYTPKANENDNPFLKEINIEEPNEASPVNISSNHNNIITNSQPTETTFLNQLPTTSTFTDTIPVISSPISEKMANPMLTTKLIAPINGKTSKMQAAKLRSINTPTPKCHQCGTLGFYKSICPKCSPIYNNNNHNHYM